MDIGLAQCIHILSNFLGMILRGLTKPVTPENASPHC